MKLSTVDLNLITVIDKTGIQYMPLTMPIFCPDLLHYLKKMHVKMHFIHRMNKSLILVSFSFLN